MIFPTFCIVFTQFIHFQQFKSFSLSFFTECTHIGTFFKGVHGWHASQISTPKCPDNFLTSMTFYHNFVSEIIIVLDRIWPWQNMASTKTSVSELWRATSLWSLFAACLEGKNIWTSAFTWSDCYLAIMLSSIAPWILEDDNMHSHLCFTVLFLEGSAHNLALSTHHAKFLPTPFYFLHFASTCSIALGIFVMLSLSAHELI